MEHGRITSVFYENGVVTCHVQRMGRVDTEHRHVPVMKPAAGHVAVPEPGQIAVMEHLDGGNERIILGFLAKNPDGANPTADEGDVVLQLDAETHIKASERGDGAGYDIDITASGDVTIDGIDFDEHTHDYEDETDTSSTTKTTDPPQ